MQRAQHILPNLMTPLTPPYFYNLPTDSYEWAGLIAFLALVILGVVFWGEVKKSLNRRQWIIFAILVLLVFVTAPFLGIRLSGQQALPAPERPEVPRDPALMILSALPWMLAGGLLGIAPSVVLGGVVGFLLGLLDTHNLFTPIELAGLALLFSIIIRQRYRTLFFQVLRHPIVAAFVLMVTYVPVFLLDRTLIITGPLVTRVDFALTHLGAGIFAMGGELFAAGIIAEVLYQIKPAWWGSHEPLIPSPSERSLQLRFFFNLGPLVFVILFFLMAGDWFVAENAARGMLEDRLSSTARVAADNVPFFLETGQNLIVKFASDDRLLTGSTDQIAQILEEDLRSEPYFRQLFLLDANVKQIASYPKTDIELLAPSDYENEGFILSLKGVHIQTYTVSPLKGESSALVAFIASVLDAQGKTKAVLWGRTDLASNPFTQSIIKTLQEMTALGGEGFIIDENGRILYHPNPSRIFSTYTGNLPQGVSFFDETAPDGTRQLVYYQPTIGRPWAILLTVHAQQVQQLALNTALPLLGIIVIISVAAAIFLFLGLRAVTASLVTLAGESSRISQGQLDHALPPSNAVDEVGLMRQAFEQMRLSLKARLEELNRLLLVSQGVASTLDFHDAVQPILQAALGNKACMARVVLVESKELDIQPEPPARLGLGPANDQYACLDNDILALTQHHGALAVPNLSRGRWLNISQNTPRPGAILAVPLKHENRFYGALWVAYENPRTFTKEETRFMNTLAGQAALAAANAWLYTSAEIGRQRLEAILASTPDPVLVTDHQNHLLLSNPAALQLPGLAEASVRGKPINEVINQEDLVGLLSASPDEMPSREIVFPNGRIYYATASSVIVDGQAVGKVCILRDITHYKELDALKSEFVATVSHDLRSPLTLMRGYATMLQMVGDLNEEQKKYVRKIISGVENMSRLVNNLLDLGRIEAGVGLRLEMVSVTEVIERVTSSLQLQAAQKNIQLLTELHQNNFPLLESDPALLQQALYNLVENAIKYTPVGGQVMVSSQPQATNILFNVRDTGIGIAPLDQPRLFEKFYRGGQREAYQQRGSGLGLAIVKSIAERHGGRVWLESQLGKGSSFFLEIPLKVSQNLS